MNVACVQYTASLDWKRDIHTALRLLEEAVAQGASIAVLPEYCAGIGVRNGLLQGDSFDEEHHPVLGILSKFASDNAIEVIAGSVGISTKDGKSFNSSFVIHADGKFAARYDKIHLCDIDLPDHRIRESASVAPGNRLVIAKTRAGAVGLSICYDLRFPQIYRRYAQAGAALITIPAAFLKKTGIAHWSTLIRARAIETGCFLFASAQCGQLENGLELYGHSMIVDPWGVVLAEAGDEPGVITASIDLALVAEARRNIPAWSSHASDTPALISLISD